MSRLIESSLTGKISKILVEEENRAKEKKICPRCGKVYTDYPAISRYDNETEICSDCGTDEAMIEFSGGKLEAPTKFKDKMSFKKEVKECDKTINEAEESKDYTLVNADSDKISELENGSAFTFEGLDISDESLKSLVDFLKEKTALKIPVTIYNWSGKEFNEKYGLTGNNAYPDDLNFVSIALDSWSEMGNLPFLKMQVGARWLDDIVDNNARRQGNNMDESCKLKEGYEINYDSDEVRPEDLEKDDAETIQNKISELENRLGEILVQEQDGGLSEDELKEFGMEKAYLYTQLSNLSDDLGMLMIKERKFNESAEDIEKFWSKDIKVGDKVESSGAGEVEILDIDKDNDYILVKRPTDYQAYVAAWAPQLDSEDRLYWGQGHYFDDEENARNYIKKLSENDKFLKENIEDDNFRADFHKNLTNYINKFISGGGNNWEEDIKKLLDITSSFKEEIDMVKKDFIEYLGSSLNESAKPKTLKEDSYDKGIYKEIEDALIDAGFSVDRYIDAGILTKNIGWEVSKDGKFTQLDCPGSWYDEDDDEYDESSLKEAHTTTVEDGKFEDYVFDKEDAEYFQNLVGSGIKVDLESRGETENTFMTFNIDNKWVQGFNSSTKELDNEIDKYFAEKYPEFKVYRNNTGTTLWLGKKEDKKDESSLKESNTEKNKIDKHLLYDAIDYCFKNYKKPSKRFKDDYLYEVLDVSDLKDATNEEIEKGKAIVDELSTMIENELNKKYKIYMEYEDIDGLDDGIDLVNKWCKKYDLNFKEPNILIGKLNNILKFAENQNYSIKDCLDDGTITQANSKIDTKLTEPLEGPIAESVTVITADGSSVNTSDAASVSAEGDCTTVVTGNTTVTICNNNMEPANELATEGELNAEINSEVVEEPVESEETEVDNEIEEPTEEIENEETEEIVEESDEIDDNETIKYKSMDVVKNQGNVFMIKFEDNDKKEFYVVCENFDKNNMSGDEFERYDSKEEADKDYFERLEVDYKD